MKNNERAEAIHQLMEAMYLQDHQLETLVETFEKQAPLHGKRLKQGEALERAKAFVRSTAFTAPLSLSFQTLSPEEMRSIANFYRTSAMKKIQLSKQEIVTFYNALQQAFLE